MGGQARATGESAEFARAGLTYNAAQRLAFTLGGTAFERAVPRSIARQDSANGEIHIRARRDERDIVLQFRDTGSGIDGDAMSRLFQQGFSTRDGGHGLGLHMSSLSVNDLGGSLHAESPGQGHGATFTVRLPIEQRQSLDPGVSSVA